MINLALNKLRIELQAYLATVHPVTLDNVDIYQV